MDKNELLQYLLNYGSALISSGIIGTIGIKVLTSIKEKMSSKAEAAQVLELSKKVQQQQDQIDSLTSMNIQSIKSNEELRKALEENTQVVSKIKN